MTKISSQIISKAKQALSVIALTAISVTTNAQTTHTFNYSGAVQTITLAAGNYSVACWGADGGNATNGTGGKGGYSQGTLTVGAPTTFYIYVGGKGTTASGPTAGGWNGGGGFTGSFTSGYNGGTGGGGTDIRTTQNTTYANRIIVAGGGGGATGYGSYTGNGGHGGGTSGGNGTSSRTNAHAGGGGSQTAGGAGATGGISGYSQSGSLGAGGDYVGTLGGTAGGGGYYGGGSGHWGGASGGGSGYVGGVTNSATFMMGETGFVTNPVTTGDGLVLITELCPISLTAAGATNSVSPLICAGQSLTLTTDAVSNYSWSTGITGTNQIVVSPATNTFYTVSGTSTAGCSTSKTMSVTVSPGLPQLTVSATSNSICLGESIAINATGALSYTFSGGITAGVHFTPAVTSNYSVTGENACGTSSAFITVTVSPLGVFAVASPTIVCANKPTTLTAVGATSYTWYPNATTNHSIVVGPAANTVYTVVGEAGNCIGNATVEVHTMPEPTITIAASASLICEGDSLTMLLSGADSYTWQNSGLSGTSVTVAPTTHTAYNVTGINSFGCTGSTQQLVLVNPRPNIQVNANPVQLCVGGTATLSASGANTYSWDSGASASSTTVNPNVTTVFTVTGTENTNGCSTTKTVQVDVYTATISVSQNTTICPGTSVNISAGSAGSYTWANGLGSSQQIVVSPAGTTVYSVQAALNLGGQQCLASNTLQVDVHPAPTVTASSSRPDMCREEQIGFSASGAQSYKWSNGLTSASFTLTAFTTNPFIFTVTGTDINGCQATDAVTVTVSNCTSINEQAAARVKLYPNPNNGTFTIDVKDQVHLTIYNSSGQIVRELKDAIGEIKIEGLARGIYVLQARNPQTHFNTGFIVE